MSLDKYNDIMRVARNAEKTKGTVSKKTLSSLIFFIGSEWCKQVDSLCRIC